ncbi:MAG: HipA domain-containing protein [Xanthomarina gelatinilytica]|uniref:HipA domain-containing protein n=1 Tax=Xanthomarina gelatinilytica TaxID=1137281 RepID=UPI003A8BFED3
MQKQVWTVFANIDDHLKNHSFIYNKESDSWNLAQAYDLTYPLNINFNYNNISIELSINDKRAVITLEDIMTIAETYAIKNPKGIIKKVQSVIESWENITNKLEIPEKVRKGIKKEFIRIIND